jgi:hypothetical protein
MTHRACIASVLAAISLSIAPWPPLHAQLPAVTSKVLIPRGEIASQPQQLFAVKAPVISEIP